MGFFIYYEFKIKYILDDIFLIYQDIDNIFFNKKIVEMWHVRLNHMNSYKTN